jgi:hypothetical protein
MKFGENGSKEYFTTVDLLVLTSNVCRDRLGTQLCLRWVGWQASAASLALEGSHTTKNTASAYCAHS